MPYFLAKREVMGWLRQGQKTIDVRKGNPRQGDVAIFVCGRDRLVMRVVSVQTGLLGEVIREDNFRQVIPKAGSVDEAWGYLRGIYGDCGGVFTAYTVGR